MAFLEAQWMHLSVLVCNEGGVASVVSYGKTGYLLPPRDMGRFATTLTHLLEHPEMLQAWRKNGRTFIEKNHGTTSASTFLVNHLRRLVTDMPGV